MTELVEILRAARAAEERGEPCWLATVMRVRGSAYRHAGARLLFSNAHVLCGSISGGCLEASIVRKGPWLTRERAACVRYEGGREQAHGAAGPQDAHDSEADEQAAFGTGCDGTVDILLERVNLAENQALAFVERCLAREQRSAQVTVFQSSDPSVPVGARLTVDESGSIASSIKNEAASVALSWAAERALRETHPQAKTVHGNGFEALLEVNEPPPHLFVFGAGVDVLPVVAFAQALGLGVTVCEANPRIAVRERFAARCELHLGSVHSALPKIAARRTALAVVMSHHYPTDRDALHLLLHSPLKYLGMLGPERRTRRMLVELFGERRLPSLDLSRLHSPIGLDLGAETPEQIALAIVAEIQAVLAGASARPLSTRAARPLHAAQGEIALTTDPPISRTGTR